MRSTRVIALAVAGLLGLASPAHVAATAPDVELRVGHDRQRGGLVWEEWTQRSGPGCVSMSSDGPGRYPRALEVADGQQSARFLFRSSLMPKRVSITAYRERPTRGSPPGEDLDYVLRERRDEEGEIVAWRAVFTIAPPPGYYLDLYARWPVGECGPPRHLYHRFHVESATPRAEGVRG